MDYKEYYNSLNDFEKKNAPLELDYGGEFDLMCEGRRVSVVGSRDASEEGVRRAKIITSILVKKNITVVSGLAKGVDTVAHTTAIRKGGKTIAVVGTPLDVVYPKENTGLYNYIKDNHLVISQFKSGDIVSPKNFPIRNRTMALISDATIIIEAKERSGTIHQGWEALRLGRQLFIMQNIKDKKYTWVEEFEKYGAQIIDRDNVEDILDELPSLTQKISDVLFF